MFDITSDREAREYQQFIIDELKKIEDKHYGEWYFLLRGQYRRAANAIRNDEFNKGRFFNTIHKETKETMDKLVYDSHKYMGDLTFRMYRDYLQKSPEQIYESEINPWAASYAIASAAIIANTTVGIFEDTLLSGISRGLDSAEIARRLLDKGELLNDVRASRITATEVHTVANKANITAIRSLSRYFRKFWVSTIDDRTRGARARDAFNHITVNGQERNIAEFFNISGEKMMYPGDPLASGGNRINCRCVMTFSMR